MSADPLAILQRAIDAFYGAPEYSHESLMPHLHRMTAPVLEEREHLLAWLDRAYAWLDARPDIEDREKREDQWVSRLQRYEEIENVLASFPVWNGARGRHQRPNNKSTTARTNRSLTPTAQPP